jgi:hypothetical protein
MKGRIRREISKEARDEKSEGERNLTMYIFFFVMMGATTLATRTMYPQDLKDIRKDVAHDILGCADRRGSFMWKSSERVTPRLREKVR